MRVCDRILLVESEKTTVNLVRTILLSNGFHVSIASCGREASAMLTDCPPDLVLLDFELPDMEGLDLIKSIRAWSCLPIIVLSSTNQIQDEVTALNWGADDYLAKPFTTSQLLAHIRVAIRHTRQGHEAEHFDGKFTTGELTVDYEMHEVLVAGEDCKLTQNEYRIVALLARYAGRVLTYDFILKELWGPEKKGGNQILRVNMANIRRKIEKDPTDPRYIFTKVGVGYWLVEEDT